MTRAETPGTELDAALDRLGQLERNLGKAQMYNEAIRRGPVLGQSNKPTKKLKQQIARQREIVRRIASGEQE